MTPGFARNDLKAAPAAAPSTRPTTRCWPPPRGGTGWAPRSRRWPQTVSSPPLVRRLGCLRGIATLTGFALAVGVGDWRRFTGQSIGSFVGLVPSEESSGGSRVQGPITKAGNTHARRLLVEAA